MRRTLAPVIVLILALAVHGCAKTGTSPDISPAPLGAVRPVTSFPLKTDPIGADHFIFSDTENSGLFSRVTLDNVKISLGIALDSSGFNKNLTTNDDTLQEIVDKFDGLVFAAAMGADDNYVTDAEKTVIGNTSGTNTGDQTTVSGTAGGLAAQYIDWNAGSGGASIANKPTIPTASDTAYDATTWDASTAVPTKNAIRDEIETFPTLTFGAGLTETDGTVTVTANTYQPIDADLTTAAGAGAAGNSTFFGKDSGGTVGFHAASSAPTVQAADPTSASATGWYAATGSGDIFYKSDDGLFTVAGSYAADPAVTIFYESFDTAPGLDNTWASFTADPDYTTAPAPLVGTQSASFDFSESGRDAVTWTSTYNIDYLIRFDAIDNATDSELFNLRDSGAVVIGRLYLTADDKLKARQGATTETSVGTILANTTYHIWLEYTPATSGDGVMAVWLTEYTGSEVKPGTVFVQESAGGSTAVPVDFVLMHTVETGGNITIDEVKIW